MAIPGELDVPATRVAARPPRAVAWVLLLSSAAAVALIGAVATLLVLASAGPMPAAVTPTFWAGFLGACTLTVASLALRGLRWVFLLRRAETRIPIRDAVIGYYAGLSLLFAPILIGEIAVRAAVHRARGRVPVATTIALTVCERWLDVVALATIAAVAALAAGGPGPAVWVGWPVAALAGVIASCLHPVRTLVLHLAAGASAAVAGIFDDRSRPDLHRLARFRTWSVALGASLLVWAMPGLGLWAMASTWDDTLGAIGAQQAYSASTLRGAVFLSPAGVLVAGPSLMEALLAGGQDAPAAALTVLAVRLATVGLAVAFGAVFVLIHLRTARTLDASHFDAIADAYDVQIPEARRAALLERKTALMREAIDGHGGLGRGRLGLDVGCGQGAYVARMRALGFDVVGIDASPGQVAMASRRVGAPGVVTAGSVLCIPSGPEAYDFVYTINVLHHLPSVEDQRLAFAELFRVLRPGGLLLVHEINTRNILFRFYMGYVFPSLNCIDEGIERWLLPDSFEMYTDVPVIDIRYFTFLPEFLPAPAVRLLRPLERRLEQSRLAPFSAHYMAVLRKPA